MFKPQAIETQQNLVCMNKHDLPISQVVWDPNLKLDQRLLCSQCVEDYESETRTMGFKKVFQIIEEKQKIKLQEYENLLMPHINSVQELESAINTLKDSLIKELDQLLMIAEEWRKNLVSTKLEISKYSFFLELDKLIKNEQNNYDDTRIKKQIYSIHTEWSNQINEKLESFKEFQEYNLCQEILKKITFVEETLQFSPPLSPIKLFSERISLKLPTQSKSSNQLSNLLSNSLIANGPFSYELVPQTSHKQTYFCRAIAINHDNSLITIASNSNIKIMEILLQDQLEFSASTINSISETDTKRNPKLLQILQGEHLDFVNTLNFFKNTPSMLNSFLSGSKDSTIIMWTPTNFSSQQQPIFWAPLFKLNGHTNSIRCLIIHPLSEDLFISGSDDKSIKFWSSDSFFQQKQQWTCLQTIKEHQDCVWGLSINQDGNQLISCGEDRQIIVMKLSYNSQWEVKQKILVEVQGMRICFICNNQFTFQACSGQALPNLQLFTLNRSSGLFIKTKDIPVQGGGQPCVFYFPSQYIPQKQLLISKNGCYVNILRLSFSSQDEIQDYQLEQPIYFGSECDGEIFGTMSDDGEFLITWDSKSKDVQIRQYQEKKK